jgi:hypothetical protein
MQGRSGRLAAQLLTALCSGSDPSGRQNHRRPRVPVARPLRGLQHSAAYSSLSRAEH